MYKQAPHSQAATGGKEKSGAAAGGKDDPAFKVKNTFLEFSMPGDGDKSNKRRTRSDLGNVDARLSPLVVASKSPGASPSLGPVDDKMQAVPIDEVAFELLEESAGVPLDGEGATERRFDETGAPMSELVAQASGGLGRDEPAYVVPTTPSPFLHSAFPPSVVPPFGGYGYGMPDMGLPPAFGADGEGGGPGGDGLNLQDVDSQYMQGLPFMPPEMYDGNFGYPWAGGWGMGADGIGDGGFQAQGEGGQELSGLSAAAAAAVAVESTVDSLDGFKAGSKDTSKGGEKATGSSDNAGAGNAASDRSATDGGRSAKEGRRGKGRGREQREEETPEEGGRGGKGRKGASGHQAAIPEAATERKEEKASEEKEHRSGEAGDVSANYTTVMLRNIPNKYTREMLIKQLSIEFHGLFDFMYLPIDFKNKCNVGYGFINFRTNEACEAFIAKFHGVDVRKCLPGLNSKKIVEVTPARVQGLSENVRRLRNSPVMNQLLDHPEWMPLLFNKMGEEEPFPMPDVPLPPVKPRGRNREARNNDG